MNALTQKLIRAAKDAAEPIQPNFLVALVDLMVT